MFDILLQRTDSSSVPEVCLQRCLNSAKTLIKFEEFVTAVLARVVGACFHNWFNFLHVRVSDGAYHYVELRSY